MLFYEAEQKIALNPKFLFAVSLALASRLIIGGQIS
jgi:hypothetical protein